jgi:hypothetical protein
MTRSAISWVMLVILCVLAVFQVLLQLSFWAALAGPEAHNAWLFQGIGTALTLIEILLLALASEFDAIGEKQRAAAARYCFVFLASINLAADYAAVSNYAGSSDVERLSGARRHEITQTGIDDADHAIARLRSQLEAINLDQPVTALRAARAPLAERAERYTRSGQAVPIQHLDRLARYDSAIAIATALETKEAERVRLLAALETDDAVAADDGPFAPLADVARVFGFDVSSEGARGAQAFAVALAVKLILTVGFWMVAPHGGDFSAVRAALRQSMGRRGEAVDPKSAPISITEAEPTPSEPESTSDGAGEGARRQPRQKPTPTLSRNSVVAMLDAWRLPTAKPPTERRSADPATAHQPEV